jgi:hypothetical protein
MQMRMLGLDGEVEAEYFWQGLDDHIKHHRTFLHQQHRQMRRALYRQSVRTNDSHIH